MTAVRLTEWEQRTLGCIADELADSAPELTSMLTVYNRLTSGEAMPDRQRVSETGEAARHRSPTRPQSPRVRRQGSSATRRRRLIPQRVWPLTAVALTVITTVVMTLVLILNGHGSGGNSVCTQAWSSICPRR
jgi:hypothetical protein